MATVAVIMTQSVKSRSQWASSWAPRNKPLQPISHIRATLQTAARSLSGLKPCSNPTKWPNGAYVGKMCKTSQEDAWVCAPREDTINVSYTSRSQTRRTLQLLCKFQVSLTRQTSGCKSRLFHWVNFAMQTKKLE